MSQKIKLRIIKPEDIEREVLADMVVMPGAEGEFGVMYGHIPMVVQLKSGEIKIYNGDKVEKVTINDGLVKVTNEGVDIVCE